MPAPGLWSSSQRSQHIPADVVVELSLQKEDILAEMALKLMSEESEGEGVGHLNMLVVCSDRPGSYNILT